MYLNQIKSKNKSEILKYLLIHVVELTDYKISCMSIKKKKKVIQLKKICMLFSFGLFDEL